MLKIYIAINILISFFNPDVNDDTINKIPPKKEIVKLTKEAIDLLHESNFEKSFAASRLALNYSIASKNDNLAAKSYNIIGANYEKMSEYDLAILNYNKGIVYAEKAKNDTIKNYIYNNLGNIYWFNKKDTEKGISFLKDALHFVETNKDSTKIVLIKLNITWAYFAVGSYSQGIDHLKFLNKYNNKFGGDSNAVIINMLNGMYAGSLGKKSESKAFFEKGIEIGKRTDNIEDLSYLYQQYSKYLYSKNDYKNAYQYLVLYSTLTKQLEDSENLKRAKSVGINFEVDEYKRKIDSITALNFLQLESLKKSKIIVLLFVIVLVILLLQMFTLYKNFLFKKKSNQDLMESNAELVEAKEMADESSRLKTQFVSTITHELRTPLYGIVGITNMLLDEHKELENSTHLNSLKFSARYLLSLINDVLQINKFEENKIVLEDSIFNIADEIDLIINSLLFIAKNNNNKVTTELDPEIPELLLGDKLRFSQILINLLSNALKFTRNGTVVISAKMVRIEGQTYFIEFQIKDNGIGIAQEDQIKIFDKFTQVGRKNLDYQGTGLGLSIVKKLLELFDSTIVIESELGVGTTFAFTIGFDYDKEKIENIINDAEFDSSKGNALSVLVVDDNAINRMVTKKIIEKLNYKCVVLESGKEAIELLTTDKFDVILMDINMPEMNGFETTKIIRSMGIMTPIIALTAFSKDEVVEESKLVGMNDIIVKPFESPELYKMINIIIANE
ncbi:response regulator [Flavobacterium algicola]|uniref:response regulator n=1 Tax=Flavobacterium algicola TaxID=556529 RepID=UPI001EFC65FA|nr:response regulator [Flavobacterium algicola]MCG9792963.1 response regulator [Flavobacterium algicola]